MSVEIEGRSSAAILEPQGFETEIYERRRSKIRYTKAFLLSCARLDICKELPPGFDPLLLRELNYAPRDETLESWRNSVDLSVNGSGERDGRFWQSSRLDTCIPSLKSEALLDNLSPRLNRDTATQENGCSECLQGERHCLPNALDCEAAVLDQSIKETQKTGIYQLCRSENPYRPPHCHKVGSTNSEDVKSNSFEERHFNCLKETQSKANGISTAKDHEMVTAHSEAVVAHEDEDINPCKSMNSGVFNEAHSMFVKKQVGCYMKAKTSNSSIVIENAMPPHLAANVESDMGFSPNLCVCGLEGLSVTVPDLSERYSLNVGMRQYDQSISNERMSGLCCFSKQRDFDDRTTRTEFSKPYEFPFVDVFDIFASSAADGILTRTCQTSTVAAGVAEKTELYDLEDNELTFEDVWSEVSALMRFEQEMDAECGPTAYSDVQIGLPLENSIMSTVYPSSSELLGGNNRGSISADSCAKIHFPDENNLIFEQEMDLTSVAEGGPTAYSVVQICLPDEDSLLSPGYSSSCELYGGNNSEDSDAEICLPDECSLISIDDMVASYSLRLEGDGNFVKDDTLTSDATYRVEQEPVTLDSSRHKTRSAPAPQHYTGSRIHGSEPSLARQDLLSLQIFQRSPCTDINAEIPSSCPLNIQQAQMRFQMPSVDPMSPETNFLAQYSLQQQPVNVAPFDTHMNQIAWNSLGLDTIQTYSLPHQLTDNWLGLPFLGLNNRTASNQFTDDMGKWPNWIRICVAASSHRKQPSEKT